MLMTNPMGESGDGPLRLDFDRNLKLDFRGSKVTSDAGLLTYAELDDAPGLTGAVGDQLVDPRRGKNGQHSMTGLFDQSVFGRLGGYEDVNNADQLGRDPVMHWIVGGRSVAKQAASTSQMGRITENRRELRGACRAVRAIDPRLPLGAQMTTLRFGAGVHLGNWLKGRRRSENQRRSRE
jgi:hypothetical protein